MPGAEPALDYTPFVTYGPSHLAVLAIFAAVCPVLVLIGRRLRGNPSAVVFSRAFALLILAVMAPQNMYLWLPAHWDVGVSMPFDLCDLAWMAAAYALWTGRAGLAYGAVYYWGLTLTTQGLITPDQPQDFPHIYFIMFFTSHCLTPAAAVYLTWGLGLRPTWKLMAQVLALTVGWGACMLVFNTLAGSNYLYVNGKPPSASILDLLGPWPYYLLGELAIGATAWALMTWPWYWGHKSSPVAEGADEAGAPLGAG